MKKTLLSLSAIAFFSVATNAQTLYSASALADFQNMAIVDADGDTQNWTVIDLMTANAGAPVGTTYDSQGEMLASFSYDNDAGAALTPDNLVITPVIDLSAATNATLSWKRVGLDPAYADENYSVYAFSAASTSQTDVATALGTAVAGTPTFTEVSDATLTTRSVNISSLVGQANVYVAFRHHNVTDEFVLLIDDIKVEQTSSIEENLISASVYPNPANDVLNIKIEGEVAAVNVLSLEGKVVATSSTATVNVADLNAGMYIYQVTTANGQIATGNFTKK